MQKVERLQGQFATRNQQDPVLSGDGEKLALIVELEWKIYSCYSSEAEQTSGNN